MSESLPPKAARLFTAPVFVVLTTINPDGRPQSSVIWTRADDGEVIFSTIRGRRKTKNMERDPRVTLIAYDPENPYSYAEVRGTARMDPDPGGALIDELSRAYDDKPWDVPDDGERLVVRVSVDKLVTR